MVKKKKNYRVLKKNLTKYEFLYRKLQNLLNDKMETWKKRYAMLNTYSINIYEAPTIWKALLSAKDTAVDKTKELKQ